MTEKEMTILKKRLIPVPKKCIFFDDAPFCIKENCLFILSCGTVQDPELIDNADRIISLYWRIHARIVWQAETGTWGKDAYAMKVTTDAVTISADSREGVLNALKTLRQLAEQERNVKMSPVFEVDPCEIQDAPAMSFRGIHLCWFPENHEWQLERAIRMAAYYKFNYIVLETWGVFPFEKHPWLCWQQPGCHISKDTLRRLVRVAREQGVCIIPQFNLLGHASGSRENGGKHVIENQMPQAMSLVEPDGWTWCISNPETRKVLTDCIDEMIECFGNAGYFHVGCDEARLIGTCRSCRKKNLRSLLKDHLLYFYQHLKDRGIRMMMWHDMLLNQDDPRWNGYIVCGKSEDGLGNLYQDLPRDLIICDWQYGYPVDEQQNPPKWPTANFFADEGFDVLMSPAGNLDGIFALSRLAVEKPLMGILETTWAHLDQGMVTSFAKAGISEWRGGNFEDIQDNDFNTVWAPAATCYFHHHLRQIENDMGVREYDAAGRIMNQVPRDVYL